VIGEEFDILDELFADVDYYVSDPTSERTLEASAAKS
jgi:hypothetical protein